MYGVPIKYKKEILAQKRQVLGKVIIDYSAPETDSSITVTANENAHITQNQQVANNIEMPTHKWASLDGTWVLDGTHYLCPDTADAAVNNEMGWWGKNLAGAGGKFIACDIDPPFVGKDFDQTGADPSFCLYDGVLYLVFVDGDYIKIAIVDQTTMAVTSLLRTIAAAGASRPRLIFEPSTYSGQPDLPHVAYVGSDGKVYGYREQYLEDLSIQAITDEIGVGTSIEALWIGDYFYHFYVDAGIIYVRKQGEYAETLITPESGAITGVWAAEMPDGRVLIGYSLATSTGGGEIYNAYSNFMHPFDAGSDRFELGASLQSIEYRAGVFVFGENGEYINYSVQDNGFELAVSLQKLQIYMLGQIDNESFKLSALLSKIVMSEPVTFDDDKFEISALLTKIVLSAPHDFTDSFQLSASLQNFEFFTP
jgi:hypothetical protein